MHCSPFRASQTRCLIIYVSCSIRQVVAKPGGQICVCEGVPETVIETGKTFGTFPFQVGTVRSELSAFTLLASATFVCRLQQAGSTGAQATWLSVTASLNFEQVGL